MWGWWGPIPLSGRVRDGVKQLCVMRRSTEREHLSEHQGEASGCCSITKALHRDKNTAVILVWNEAALFSYSLTRPRGGGGGVGEESLPAVKANSCIKPLAPPPSEWVQADVNNKGWRCFKYLFGKKAPPPLLLRCGLKCVICRESLLFTRECWWSSWGVNVGSIRNNTQAKKAPRGTVWESAESDVAPQPSQPVCRSQGKQV